MTNLFKSKNRFVTVHNKFNVLNVLFWKQFTVVVQWLVTTVIYSLSLILYLSYNILLGQPYYTRIALCHAHVKLFQGNNQIFHYSEHDIKPGHYLSRDYSWDSLNDLYYWLLDKNSQNAVGIGFLTLSKNF
jgi:hypothetical protein